MTLDHSETIGHAYAVIGKADGRLCYTYPTQQISIYSNIRAAHEFAAKSGGVVVRVECVTTAAHPIGRNGKRLRIVPPLWIMDESEVAS